MFDMNFALTIKRLAVAFVPLMLGIILHEVSHGWMAARRGDPTATMLGRITLNPLPHIDPAGLMFFVISAMFSPFVLGWAKPVPINPRNFKHLVKDTMLVSFAGPAANFALALISALLMRVYVEFLPPEQWHTNGVWSFFFLMLYSSVSINFALAWFNLMPVPPLDGSKILWGVLPPKLAYSYMQLERYGMMIIILLLVTGAFRFVLFPLVSFSIDFTLTLAGIR